MLRWLAGGQIAIIQNCVAEENALHYVFYPVMLTNSGPPFQLTLLSDSSLRYRLGSFLEGKRCFLDRPLQPPAASLQSAPHFDSVILLPPHLLREHEFSILLLDTHKKISGASAVLVYVDY